MDSYGYWWVLTGSYYFCHSWILFAHNFLGYWVTHEFWAPHVFFVTHDFLAAHFSLCVVVTPDFLKAAHDFLVTHDFWASHGFCFCYSYSDVNFAVVTYKSLATQIFCGYFWPFCCWGFFAVTHEIWTSPFFGYSCFFSCLCFFGYS